VKDSGVISGSDTSSTLLARLRVQDKDAWNRFVQLYGPLVYGWCRQRGLQAEDAADVLQDVCRAVTMNVKDFRAGSFRGWLWTITRNRVLDFFRRRQRQANALGGSDAQQRWAEIPEALHDFEQSSSAMCDMVRSALAMIRPDFSDETWQAFQRVVMDDQTPAEVARELAISVNAVYIAKSRVLRRLRDMLGEDCH
jgi:RNA polymerase sigma-70 factor (ECF subfamily)